MIELLESHRFRVGLMFKENLAHMLKKNSCSVKETFRHMAWGRLEQVRQNVGQSGEAEVKLRLNSIAATQALDLKSH